MKLTFPRGFLPVILLVASATSAMGQAFPVSGQPINIIVPYPAGGGTDTSARIMAAGLSNDLHATVQIINRPGAASQVGMTELARSRPDGMTLGYAVLPALLTSYLDPRRQAIYARKSFQPIATHYIATMMLAVRADASFHTLRDLVEAARAAPGKITIADSGLMGTPNLTALMLDMAAGVETTSVHFPGGPPSVTAVLGGQVRVLAGGISDALPYLRAGQFRVLGVAADAPDPAMPDVPTMRAQGYDVVNAAIGGIVAPAGTPASTVALLAAAIKKVVEDPDQAKKLAAFGSAPYYNDPDGFSKIWADNEARVKPILERIEKQ
jgi:tripartite-type tricarboxylate transporter receptor subunit TctC